MSLTEYNQHMDAVNVALDEAGPIDLPNAVRELSKKIDLLAADVVCLENAQNANVELERRVTLLAADTICLEDAMDASVAERKLLRSDLEITMAILTKFISKVDSELDRI